MTRANMADFRPNCIGSRMVYFNIQVRIILVNYSGLLKIPIARLNAHNLRAYR
jgi:hypothetical protein